MMQGQQNIKQVHILPKYPHTPTHYKTSSNNYSTRYTTNESHNTVEYLQYEVTLKNMVLLSPIISPWLTSLLFTSKQNHFT